MNQYCYYNIAINRDLTLKAVLWKEGKPMSVLFAPKNRWNFEQALKRLKLRTPLRFKGKTNRNAVYFDSPSANLKGHIAFLYLDPSNDVKFFRVELGDGSDERAEALLVNSITSINSPPIIPPFTRHKDSLFTLGRHLRLEFESKTLLFLSQTATTVATINPDFSHNIIKGISTLITQKDADKIVKEIINRQKGVARKDHALSLEIFLIVDQFTKMKRVRHTFEMIHSASPEVKLSLIFRKSEDFKYQPYSAYLKFNKMGIGRQLKKEKHEYTPLALTITISKNGFVITAQNADLSPQKGCPTSGPTICLLTSNKDIIAMLSGAQKKFNVDDFQGGDQELQEALSAYNWRALSNTLSEIKSSFQTETTISIQSEDNIPFILIARVMDIALFKLEKDSYKNTNEFWSAKPKIENGAYDYLFPFPNLILPKEKRALSEKKQLE